MKPVRLQLSRRKGFDLQALSKATNGLAAVSVARPHRWGNPYRVGDDTYLGRAPDTVEQAVAWFRKMIELNHMTLHLREQLAGKNLACWCKAGRPCHADVLLELANPPLADMERKLGVPDAPPSL